MNWNGKRVLVTGGAGQIGSHLAARLASFGAIVTVADNLWRGKKSNLFDQDGKPVFLADDEIVCSTDGPVELLGLEASNPTDMGDYTDNRQRVYQGKMIAYVQATGEKGPAKVILESPWLEKAVIELNIE